MSLGGDFYALTDDQLKRLLSNDLRYEAFLYDSPGEHPRECLSAFEHLWHELGQVLADEAACGAELSEVIPEFCGYSFSDEVEDTAQSLESLDEETILARCEEAGIEASPVEVWEAVRGVAAFYRRAAEHHDAVLFRVT